MTLMVALYSRLVIKHISIWQAYIALLGNTYLLRQAYIALDLLGNTYLVRQAYTALLGYEYLFRKAYQLVHVAGNISVQESQLVAVAGNIHVSVQVGVQLVVLEVSWTALPSMFMQTKNMQTRLTLRDIRTVSSNLFADNCTTLIIIMYWSGPDFRLGADIFNH